MNRRHLLTYLGTAATTAAAAVLAWRWIVDLLELLDRLDADPS